MSGKGYGGFVLPMVLVGAVLLSGTAFAGLMLSLDRSDDGEDHVRSHEVRDNDSDGRPEMNHTFAMMGSKYDPDGDGNTDTERGSMMDIKEHDHISSGYVEPREEDTIGFLKEDYGSDGVIDNEKYAGLWKKVKEIPDDRTEITEESGAWTSETPRTNKEV